MLISSRLWSLGFPLPQRWRDAVLVAAVPALLLLFIIFALEPSGTDRYRGSWRSLRLSGYAICVFLPLLLLQAAERGWYGEQRATRLFGTCLVTRLMVSLLIISACYFYNIGVINDLAPSWPGWWGFSSRFALPYVVLLMPLSVYLEYRLARRAVVPSGESPKIADAASEPLSTTPQALPPLLLRGRNSGDVLSLAAVDFVYAEALQNYVSIVFITAAGVEKRILRTTLSDMASQIPFARRIHRSFLINPLHLLRVDGSRRKRQAWMQHIDQPLPHSE